ncbi:glycosyltransferase family 4 protein [Parvularcula oceani]|uniref:glycosyltransferase family 4 protein n=1 Tax=Parvularcula oceani TaxID=1247963 RepID=UPI0004E25B8E|nr:glycosyltransferase family 4 protein [Parvularcula oceani]
MRVLLVAPNASARMGGEAVLPLHYLRELTAAGVEAELLTHARCREELTEGSYRDYPLHFVEDSSLEHRVWRATKDLPTAFSQAGDLLTGTITGYRLRSAAEALLATGRFDLAHQITPVSPRAPSFLGDAEVPLICGPMNGNMTYPPGFERSYGEGTGMVSRVIRTVSDTVNGAAKGKRQASRLLVANPRTAAGLPHGTSASRVTEIVENGVDLARWPAPDAEPGRDFVFVGRLVHWKAVDLLIDAFAQLEETAHVRILGDGPKRAALEAQVQKLGLSDRVHFDGFVSAEAVRTAISGARALVLPSVYECGGAVVLEAMACARPVVATDWGGPADYVLQDETGILVPPSSPTALAEGLGAGMRRLAEDDALAARMGQAGRRRVEEKFSWKAKAAAVRGVYEDVLAEQGGSKARAA